jgi:hypothetical protein
MTPLDQEARRLISSAAQRVRGKLMPSDPPENRR